MSTQHLDLLRENLLILCNAVRACEEASIIEESGRPDESDYRLLIELNDETFVFHFRRDALCRLLVFDNVPAGLQYLRHPQEI